MKNVVIAMALVFGLNAAYAQEKKDTYQLDGDLIEAVLYHDNGEVAQMGTYDKKGVLHGDWISFDREGNVRSVGHYENGKKVGTWRFYVADEMREVTYTDAKIVQVDTWKIVESRLVTN
jgi:antitoxin component YwqK of YwqJK toxin-antitoxin module